ncbi:hypothetical protein GCM10027360_01340 [Amycolatopsis echigonensis]
MLSTVADLALSKRSILRGSTAVAGPLGRCRWTWKTGDNKHIVSQVSRTAADTITERVPRRHRRPAQLRVRRRGTPDRGVCHRRPLRLRLRRRIRDLPTGTQANAGLNTNRMRLLDQTASGTAKPATATTRPTGSWRPKAPPP